MALEDVNAPVKTPEEDAQEKAAAPAPSPAPVPQPQQAPAAPAAGRYGRVQNIAPPAPPPEIAAETQKDSLIARVARTMLGEEKTYQIDPATGRTKVVPVRRTPGQFFRHILAGAIMGGVAGAGADTMGEGFSRGGLYVAGRQEKEDETKRRMAQEEFQNVQVKEAAGREQQRIGLEEQRVKQESARIAQQETQFKAQMAHMEKEFALQVFNANARERSELEQENQSAEAMSRWVTEVGGIPASWDKNAQTGNAQAFMEDFKKNPDAFKPPTGYARVTTKTYDLSGLRYNYEGKGWEDEQGKRVSIADRTQVSVTFVPQRTANQPISITGSDLRKQFPGVVGNMVKGDSTYQLTLSDLAGLSQRQAEMNRVNFEEKYRRERDKIMNIHRSAKEQILALRAQKQGVYDPTEISRINAEITQIRSEYKAALKSISPEARPELEAWEVPEADEAVGGVVMFKRPNGDTIPVRTDAVDAFKKAFPDAEQVTTTTSAAAPAAAPAGTTLTQAEFDREQQKVEEMEARLTEVFDNYKSAKGDVKQTWKKRYEDDVKKIERARARLKVITIVPESPRSAVVK